MPYRDHPSDVNIVGAACPILRDLARHLGEPDKAMPERLDNLTTRSAQARSVRLRTAQSQTRAA